MPTPVEIGFEANGEQSVKRAWETVAKGCEDAIRSLAKFAPESNKADAAQRQLTASSEKWLKAISTPLQDYLGDLEELRQLLEAGKLSQDQYNAALDITRKRLESQNTEIDALGAKAAKLRESLITPQQRYQQELADSNELLRAGKITQDEYAAAVAKATDRLDSQDASLQALLRDASRINEAAVTPQQKYAAAISRADELLKKGKITQAAYNNEVKNAKEAYAKATIASQQFIASADGGTRGATLSVSGLVGTVTALGTAYSVVTTAVRTVLEENKRLSKSIDEVFNKLDQEELKYQIQAGLTPVQVEQQMPNIEQALTATPSTTVAGAIQIQTQLASSGFNNADVQSSEALQTVLDLKAATNQFGESMGNEQQAILSLANFLKANGIDNPRAAQIRQVGAQLTTLFETSDIQFPHLSQLAPHAASLAQQGIEMTDQLSAFSVLDDVMGPERAGSGLRNMVTRTATAKATPERVKALKKLGLKPEDVDIAKGGDQFIPTLQKISARLQTLKPEQQNLFLTEMYGEEAQAAAAVLLNPEKLKLIVQRNADQKNGKAFDRGVQTFRESEYARQQRLKNKTELNKRKTAQNRKGPGWKDMELQYEAAQSENQLNENWGATAALGIANWGFTWGESLGMTPEQTAQWFDGKWGTDTPTLTFKERQRNEGKRGKPVGQGQPPVPPRRAPAAGPERQAEPQAQPEPQDGGLQRFKDAAGNSGQDQNPAAEGRMNPTPMSEATAKELTQVLRENTTATRENTNRPPAAPKGARPINKPTPAPKSAVLAAAGGR